MPTTTNWALPYPSANDAPNGASQVAALAAAVDTALESRKSLFVRKTGDTSRSSTTTLADDPELTLTVAANATYLVDVGLWYVSTSQTAGDFRGQLFAPAGAAMQAAIHSLSTTAAAGTDDVCGSITLSFGWSVGVNSTAEPWNPLMAKGVLVVGSTAGAFKLQWAQNFSHATATTLKANSYLALRRVA